MSNNQLELLITDSTSPGPLTPGDVHRAFDPARLTQARELSGYTKKRLAERIGVTAAAVSQYELSTAKPRPDLLPRIADVLDVPMAFFLAGRPRADLDNSAAHFRSLRSARAYQRAKAIAYTEQAWELTHALEKRVQLPSTDLAGFADGEVHPDAELAASPITAARRLRTRWRLGDGPVTHLVRRMETHGIVVLMPAAADADSTAVDAFSTSRLPRPVVVLTPNRADDVYRHRFTAAHELGHLILHSDTAPGDTVHEDQADAFAAEFLTPRESILPHLPTRTDFRRLADLQRIWGVSVKSLLHRCRETGLLSDSAASRAYQRLNTLRGQPGFKPESVSGYPGEQPTMLAQAFRLACDNGLTLSALAEELAWRTDRVQELLGIADTRPKLRLLE